MLKLRLPKLKLPNLRKPNLKPSSGVKEWYEKQRSKRAADRAKVPTMLRVLTFATTLASMILALSLMPLFPQPLPIVIAFLIAFLSYENPIFSLPVGGVLIGLGLIYNMSKVNFISSLGSQFTREAVVAVLLFLFIALPIIFHKHKAAIAINLGITAAILLFSGQAYFLAIPLIFASILIFKKLSVLTVVYYGLISTPFFMMQYLGYIIDVAETKTDWWVLPGSSPPIFVPLTQILKSLQESMAQFRLYDTSQVVYAITAQVTQDNPPADHTIMEVLSHYLDSIPGIVLFLVIIAVLVSAFVLLMRVVLQQAHFSNGERILPPITAAVGTLLFLVLLSALQGPLAFRAQIDGGKMAIGTLAAVLFTLPAFFIDQTPKKRATVDMIAKKAQEILDRLQTFERSLIHVQENLPMDVSAIEGKMLILKDRLIDTLDKTTKTVYEPSEIDGSFNELDATSKEVDNLTAELDTSLKAYQMLVEGEYATWIGKFSDIGFEVNPIERKDFQQELPIKERVTLIKETADAGTLLVDEIIKVMEQAYKTIRSLYDPKLPPENQAIIFAKKQLDEKVNPWIAASGLYAALNNWKKQYSVDIAKSAEYIQDSITLIGGWGAQEEALRGVLGADLPRLMAVAKRAENLTIEKDAVNIGSVVGISNVLQSSLDIVKEALLVLGGKLDEKENSIDRLLPTEDYMWERNTSLKERMASATEAYTKPSEYGLKQALTNMPNAISYLDECMTTIARYNDQEELLLNFPVAETAIEDAFKQKTFISVHDLPFDSRFAEEYLRLFYSKRFRDYSFDDQKVTLKRNVG